MEIQLAFYKNVIFGDRKVPQSWFSKTKNGVKYTFNELFEKLVQAIESTIVSEDNGNVVLKAALKPQNERIAIYEEQKKILAKRVTDSRLAIFIETKAKRELPMVLNNPQLLIGCRIHHKVKETTEDEEVWCTGKVIDITNQPQDQLKKTEYMVIYDDDPSKYVFQLIIDLEKKSMIIISELSNDDENR